MFSIRDKEKAVYGKLASCLLRMNF